MEWYDMNALWEEIRKDSRFTNEGVQNPIVTFVALVIMAGNDFFAGPNKNFLPDVGTERFVWPAFAENARQFSHMFQLSWVLEPDCRALRHVVVDRDAFVDFAHHCYVFKHGEQAKKRYNSDTLESIEQLLTDREENRVKGVRKKLAKATEEEEKAKLEAKLALRPANAMVDTERLRVFAAHLDFCLNYWFNGYRGTFDYPNAFARTEDASLWGFEDNPPRIAATVARTVFQALDENYARHMVAHKRARMGAE